MDIRIIKAPAKNTMEIIRKRSGRRLEDDFSPAAVGLVQGKLIEMLVASDIAEKCAGVTTSDLRGSCPQNLICLAIFGDTAEVMSCLDAIRDGAADAYC